MTHDAGPGKSLASPFASRSLCAALISALVTTLSAMAANAVDATAPPERIAIPLKDCSTATFGATAPAGVTFTDRQDELAIVDTQASAVYFLEADDCTVTSEFSISPLDVSAATGIAFDALNARYAIIDGAAPAVRYATPEGSRLGGCSLTAIGVSAPAGITWDGSTGRFAIADDGANEIVQISGTVTDAGPCELVARESLADTGISMPTAVAWHGEAGDLAVADLAALRISLLTAALEGDGSFSTLALDTSAPSGLAFDTGTSRFALTDDEGDRVYLVDARGTVEIGCSVDTISLFTKIDMTGRLDIGEVVIIDSTDGQTAYFVDAATCGLKRQLNLAAAGIVKARGVLYLPDSDELLVSAEGTGDIEELFFLDYTTGTLNSRCGVPREGEVSLVDDTPWIVHGFNQGISVLDRSCNAQFQISLAAVGARNNISSFSYQARSGTLLADGWFDFVETEDELQLTTFAGQRLFGFSTEFLGVASPAGMVRLADGDGVLGLVNSQDDARLVTFRIPRLREQQRPSGTFVRDVIRLILLERGAQLLTGFLTLGTDTVLPAIGRTEATEKAGGAAIALTILLPRGDAITLEGTYSPDGEGVTLQGLGPLQRQY